MRDYYFISSLPRSGSALLSGIFRQNPDFYADVTSPLHNLVLSAIETIAEADNPYAIDDGHRKQILRFVPPTPYPDDGKPYYWDEPTLSWQPVT